jgi:hypothetical protein
LFVLHRWPQRNLVVKRHRCQGSTDCASGASIIRLAADVVGHPERSEGSLLGVNAANGAKSALPSSLGALFLACSSRVSSALNLLFSRRFSLREINAFAVSFITVVPRVKSFARRSWIFVLFVSGLPRIRFRNIIFQRS